VMPIFEDTGLLSVDQTLADVSSPPIRAAALLGLSSLAGALAGAFAALVTHPMDTLVVRKQSNRPPPRTLRDWYRGVGISMIGTGLIDAAMMGSFEGMMDLGLSPMLAAAAAGIPEASIRGPMEATKIMQQVKLPITSRSIALGTGVMFAKEIPGNVLFLCVYHELKGETTLQTFGAGAFAGLLHSTVIYPIDALRTQLVTGEKLRFTYRGSAWFSARSLLASSIFFAAYELLLDRFDPNRSLRTLHTHE
jgi:hypothetical protein